MGQQSWQHMDRGRKSKNKSAKNTRQSEFDNRNSGELLKIRLNRIAIRKFNEKNTLGLTSARLSGSSKDGDREFWIESIDSKQSIYRRKHKGVMHP